MNQEVSVVTGEVATVPTVAADLTPISMALVKQRLAFVEEFIRENLVEGVDYGTIPGTSKNVLWKPGAEKLMMGFNLGPTYEVIDEVEDHGERWYHYKVLCRLIHRSSGAEIGNCIKTCNSSEKGKGGQPGNTIISMAEKRAMVGATVTACMVSDRFTVDLEDYKAGEQGPPKRTASKGKPTSTEKGSDTVRPRDYWTGESNYDSKYPCWICMEDYTKGTKITAVEMPDGRKKYGHAECVAQWLIDWDNNLAANDKPAPDGGPDQPISDGLDECESIADMRTLVLNAVMAKFDDDTVEADGWVSEFRMQNVWPTDKDSKNIRIDEMDAAQLRTVANLIDREGAA